VLCVVYGLFDSTLFAILPFDVTSKAVVEKAYTTYTVDHLVEGVALAVIGLVGFFATKKPLSKLGRVPDVDRLYNPLVFYGTRAVVVGVTELYAAVDRVVVAAASTTVWAVEQPREAIAAVGASDEEPLSLRAGIGTSVLVLAVVVTVGLVVML